MGIENLEKIIREQQRGKEDSHEYCIGEHLLDMARRSSLTAELLEQDLAVPGMSLADAAQQMQLYADKKEAQRTKKEGKKNGGVGITQMEAEKILRGFYHLPEEDAAQPAAGGSAPIVNLADFL